MGLPIWRTQKMASDMPKGRSRARNLMLLLAIGMVNSGCKNHAQPSRPQTSPRWPNDPPAKTYPQVVVVGDSIMAWMHITDSLAGAINHAIPGQPIISVADHIYEDALVYHPKVVVVQGGINDWNQNPAVTVDREIQSRLQILNACLAAGVKVYMVNISQFNGDDPNMKNTAQNLSNIARLNHALAEMCADPMKCTLIDMSKALGPWNTTNFIDCIHPSVAGYTLINAAFYSAMGRYYRKSMRSPRPGVLPPYQ